MHIEFYITLIIIAVCSIIMLILNSFVSGLLSLIIGTQFKRIFVYGLFSLLIPIFFITYGMLLERNWYKINTIDLSYNNLPEAFDNYKIIHLSDIHARSFKNRTHSLYKAFEKINEQNPDLIVFTGDLITLSHDEIDKIQGPLQSLTAKDGIISILGNHDYGIYNHKQNSNTNLTTSTKELIDRESQLGWTVLLNDHHIITKGVDSIAIVGVENISTHSAFPSKGDLIEASDGTNNLFRILLSHDPTHWEKEVLGNNFPLTLSGHTHAMQLSLLGWCPSKYLFKQYKGLYQHNEEYLYVNTGLGETIFPARIGVRPEITVIRLKCKEK